MAINRRHFNLAAAALAAGPAAAAASPGGEWNALQIVPLSGVNGGVGWHLSVGAQVAFAQANAGGPPHGRPLRLVTLDEEPGHIAEQVRQRLRSDNPVALLAWHGRRSVGELSRARLLEETGLPMLGVMSGSLTAPGFGSPWLFATRGSVSDEIDQVFRHAVVNISEAINAAAADAGIAVSSVDWFIPHQANIRILEGVARRAGIDEAKVITTLDQHANTSAASIPLALDQGVRDGRIQPGQMLLLEAMGGGLTWGACVLRL